MRTPNSAQIAPYRSLHTLHLLWSPSGPHLLRQNSLAGLFTLHFLQTFSATEGSLTWIVQLNNCASANYHPRSASHVNSEMQCTCFMRRQSLHRCVYPSALRPSMLK